MLNWNYQYRADWEKWGLHGVEIINAQECKSRLIFSIFISTLYSNVKTIPTIIGSDAWLSLFSFLCQLKNSNNIISLKLKEIQTKANNTCSMITSFHRHFRYDGAFISVTSEEIHNQHYYSVYHAQKAIFQKSHLSLKWFSSAWWWTWMHLRYNHRYLFHGHAF